jgi:hypothetical protein
MNPVEEEHRIQFEKHAQSLKKLRNRKNQQAVRQADGDFRKSGSKVNPESSPHTQRRYYAA